MEQQRREAAAKQKMAFEHAEAGSAVSESADTAEPPAPPQPVTRATQSGAERPVPAGW